MSFRLRLTLLFTVVLAALLLGFAATFSAVTEFESMRSVDRELERRATLFYRLPPPSPEIRRQFERRDPGGSPLRPPPGFPDDELRPLLIDRDGNTLGPGPDRALLDNAAWRSAQPGQVLLSTVQREDDEIRVATLRIPGGELAGSTIQVGQSLQGVRQALATQRSLYSLFFPVGIALAGLAAWFLAGRALAPLRALTAAAETIGEADLSRRIPVARADEFGRLADAFNAMLARLQLAFAQREELLRRQRQFVGDASHELRTPLARLKLATTSALSQGANAEELRQALTRADAAGTEMSRLVTDLLALAQVEGEAETTPEPGSSLGNILRTTVHEADDPRVQLSMTDEADVPVAADLQRALQNILANARRYAPAHSAIEVSARRDSDGLVIAVRDYGPGVPHDALAKLGTRFFRADSARSRKDGSFGLGLSIARAIVARAGGDLRFTNAHPGLCAEIRLPIGGTLVP
jgi:signal transduction histidine kinase